MKSKIYYLTFFLVYFNSNFLFSQNDYQSLEKFVEGQPYGHITYAWDWNDPNVCYWDQYIQFDGLPVLSFDLFSIPFELFAYQTQIGTQTTECIDSWNQHGCTQLDENMLSGVELKFDDNSDNWPDIALGQTGFAVIQTLSKYYFAIYPGQSLTKWPITQILLNKTDEFYNFGYHWTVDENPTPNDYKPFKAVLLHELGHLIGFGHFIDPENFIVMSEFHPQMLFALTSIDIDNLSDLCQFMGQNPGIISSQIPRSDKNNLFITPELKTSNGVNNVNKK